MPGTAIPPEASYAGETCKSHFGGDPVREFIDLIDSEWVILERDRCPVNSDTGQGVLEKEKEVTFTVDSVSKDGK
jgi:hypothetical protein